MKTRLFLSAAALLVAISVLIACSPTAVQSTPAEPVAETPLATEPQAVAPNVTEAAAESVPTVAPDAAVVLNMVERINAEDYEGAMEYVADDIKVYFIGMPATGFEFYSGKEQFLEFMNACCRGQHFVWEVTPGTVMNGIVWAQAKTWHDFTRELGVAPNSFHEVFVVEDGKIVTYSSTMTEEALAKFKPALAAAMPPAEAVAPSADAPVSEMTVTLEGDTCTYDGPMVLQAGELTVNAVVKDELKEYAVSFFTLDADKDFTDLMASTVRPAPPPWSRMISIRELGARKLLTYDFPVKEGQVYMVCWSRPPDMPIGQAGPFEVRP
jgi:hypothetical protein